MIFKAYYTEAERQTVRNKDSRLSFFILFLIFIFLSPIFIILDLGLVWCHALSHMSQSQVTGSYVTRKNIENSKRIMSYSMLYIYLSRLLMEDFILFFLFSLYFLFLFLFLFILLFLEYLGLGFICHAVTSVTNWWCSHKTDHGTWKNEVEDTRIKWCHTAWTTYAGLMLYLWSFRVGCTVASTDHG